ncbi:MAG TPA: V-type ATP synthase subunit E family protein [Patescibacteria group bacterium]|nr:V-type ATP synthase subunit E family protein [Patescibacteria group bacterium]
MKTDKKLIKQNLEHSEEICAKIRQEAERQCEMIASVARKEADRVVAEAKKEADAQIQELHKAARQQLEKTRERMFSTLNLEKKRVLLEGKGGFSVSVLEAVKKRAAAFRDSREYPAFLKKAILEGVGVVDAAQIEVAYSFLDEKIMNDDFVRDIRTAVRNAYNKEYTLDFRKDGFKDIGVMLQSHDGHFAYDNTFGSRLQRSYDDVYMWLLKESF